jgi:hypothetical protein
VSDEPVPGEPLPGEPVPGEAVLRVVRGQPTDEELAALVAVVLSHRPARPPAPGRSRWARVARAGGAEGPLPGRRGPDAWRSSGLPR